MIAEELLLHPLHKHVPLTQLTLFQSVVLKRFTYLLIVTAIFLMIAVMLFKNIMIVFVKLLIVAVIQML